MTIYIYINIYIYIYWLDVNNIIYLVICLVDTIINDIKGNIYRLFVFIGFIFLLIESNSYVMKCNHIL